MDSVTPHPKTTTVPQPASHPQTSFPIIAISLIGIILTVTFLVSYYIFMIKCCLNQHNSDIIQRLLRSRRRWAYHPTHNRALPSFHPIARGQGLHEAAIQAIPILSFKADGLQNKSSHECSVCLYEFEEEERIRMLPNCFHIFHIDCIDTWLQTHSNCPLCRAAVTCTAASIQNTHPGDVAVVVDVGEEWINIDKKVSKGLSFGDECIDFRGRDEEFAAAPIRRSFSLGSCSDRRLYAAVEEILRQNPHFRESFNGEGSSMGSACNYSDTK